MLYGMFTRMVRREVELDPDGFIYLGGNNPVAMATDLPNGYVVVIIPPDSVDLKEITQEQFDQIFE